MIVEILDDEFKGFERMIRGKLGLEEEWGCFFIFNYLRVGYL